MCRGAPQIPYEVSVATATLACMEKIDKLIEQVSRGERVKYLPFWGHRPRPDGTLGPSCMSQWWPSPFTVGDVRYDTAEHWMMAGKARLFGDAEAERAALEAKTPAEAKKAGRLVRGFDEAIWTQERFALVVEGSVHKFASTPSCARTCCPPGTGCWWRRARWTASGASDWRRTTSAPWTRPAGAG